MGLNFNELSQKSIEELDEGIKQSKRENRKFKFKVGIKYALTTATAAAIVLGPAIGAGILFGKVGHSPFKRDDIKHNKHVRTEITSDGKTVTSQYEPFENEENSLEYHYDWNRTESQYVKTVETYNIDGMKYEDISEYLVEDSEPNREVLGNPIKTQTTYAYEVPSNVQAHYEGVIYEVDENDYLVTKQNEADNLYDMAGSFIIPGVIGVVITVFVVPKMHEGLCIDSDYWHGRMCEQEIDMYEETKSKKLKLTKKNSD